MRDAMNDYKLEHIFSYVGRLADPPRLSARCRKASA